MDWDDVRELGANHRGLAERVTKENDELKRRLSRLADVVERLAKDRHERLGHTRAFPGLLLYSQEECADPICHAAAEAAR